MKRGKKLLVTILCIVMMVTTLTACSAEGTGKPGKGKNVITVNYWLSGMGEQWLIDMIEAFEAEYPEYTVEYQASARKEAVTSALGWKTSMRQICIWLLKPMQRSIWNRWMIFWKVQLRAMQRF